MRAQPHTSAGSSPVIRMLVIGGLLAAIAAGLVVRGILNAGLDDPVMAKEHVRAVEAESGPAIPPPEVSSWTPGGSAPASVEAAPPAWSNQSFPVAPVEPPSDPSKSMVGIAPATSRVREAVRQGRVFTNDDLVGTRSADTPAPAPAAAPAAEPPAPPPMSERPAPRGDTLARGDAGQMSVAAAQRRVLAIRDRARATGQDLDDEMEAAIDEVRDAQRRERRESE